MTTLFTLRRFAAVVTALALMVGGLGVGAASATAETAGVPTALTDFPLNPTAIVAFNSSHYVVGGDGRLYEWADDTATLVPNAPESITVAVAAGSYLYVLSAPEGGTAVTQRFDGSAFVQFSTETPTGLMVAKGIYIISTIMNADGPAMENRGPGGDYGIMYMAPTGVQALAVVGEAVYAANSSGLWVNPMWDFELIPNTPTDIIGTASIGTTLYLRSATHIYSLTGSAVTTIAEISTSSMTVANDRLYVKRADSSEILVLDGSGFTSLPFSASGERLVTMDALLIFADGTSVSSYDGLEPPIMSTSSSPVSAAVTPGSLTASLTAVAFESVPFSHDERVVSTPTSATLVADDQTGLLYGWDVTLKASALVWTSPSAAVDVERDISAENLSVYVTDQATRVFGDDFTGTTLGVIASLDSAVSVISTSPGQGSGSYTVPLGFRLAIPANAAAGSYVGTLTTTISAAP